VTIDLNRSTTVKLAPFRTAPAGVRARASKGNGSFRRRHGGWKYAPGLIPNWSLEPYGKRASCAGRPTASNRCALSAERPSAFSWSERQSSTAASMRVDLASRLRRTMRGEAVAETVTGVSGVTATPAIRLKPQQLRQLRQLRLENADGEKSAREGVFSPVAAPIAPDFDAIEERAVLAADCVPARYLDAWARLQCQRPFYPSLEAWRQAIEDSGLFLDAWGAEAATMRWTAGELFDVPREGTPGGLVWQLKGERVEALDEARARLRDGRTIRREYTE
jgi:hypothetical protein